ncbi:MAG TPA: lysine--tRNA ligase, partial [bacterium]|nr:lysine--tRNA ligase [bacterium]
MAKHWAVELGEKIIARRGNDHVVSIGVSPSGPIHVGFLREIVIGDVIRRTLSQMGANAKLVLTSDDMDPLRHVYPFLPKSYSENVGQPLCRIPDPEGCCPSYAEHFIRPLEKAFVRLGVEIEVRRSSEKYDAGLFTDTVKQSLEKRQRIVDIIREESGRELGEDWTTYNAICSTCGRLTTTTVQECDVANHRIRYQCQNGHEGWADYSKAEGKLPWRIDWAARWHVYGVTVEPFGKDHAGAGGSYDTGSRFSREIFDSEPPEPIPYEWIELRGLGPMSSSKGVVITITDILEAVPAQLMRYLLVRTRASKHITFDPCVGLLQLWDEYEKIAQAIQTGDEAAVTEIDRANYDYSLVPDAENPATLGISFKHLATAVQLAGDSESVLRESLLRSGYRQQCEN